jgi:hypothetical protein
MAEGRVAGDGGGEVVELPIVNGTMNHWSYVGEQGDLLRKYLREIGPGRVRGNWAPAADGIVDLGVVVQWVALAFAAGFVGQAGSNFYTYLRGVLARYVADAKARFDSRPCLNEVRIEYADLDVIIRIPSNEELPDFAELMLLLAERLTSGRLREVPMGVVEVFMPMRYEAEIDQWMEHYYPESCDEYGVWAITGVTSGVVVHPYDAINDQWLKPMCPWME